MQLPVDSDSSLEAGVRMNTTHPLIDLRLIESIRSVNSDGLPDLLAVLVTIFKETAPDMLSALHKSVGSKDARMTQHLAHRLRGCSGNVGARQMARLCRDLETLVKNEKDATDAQILFATAINEAYRESLLALTTMD